MLDRSKARLSIAALAAGMMMLAPPAAQAGPWTPDPGRVYLKLWVKEYCNCGFGYMEPSGNVEPIGFYDEIFLNAYGEVGIVPGLAAWLHWPIVETFLLEDPRPTIGRVQDRTVVGDPTLGLRWRFLRIERFVAALDAAVRLPLAPPGVQQAVYSTDPGYPRIGGLRVGTGVWDFPLAISIGYGWDRFYLAGSGGYVPRTDGYDHVLTWSAEGGGTFDGGFSLRLRVIGWHALGNGDPALYHQSPSGIGSGTNYTGFAVEMDYPIAPDWWFGGTIEGGIAGISRQSGGPVITLYAATRFSLVPEPAPSRPAREPPPHELPLEQEESSEAP